MKGDDNMYNSSFNDICLYDGDDLHDALSIVKKVKYHNEILNVDNWYYNGNKFIIECNNKEYQIYNDLGLYVVEELEENYIEIFDVVKQ